MKISFKKIGVPTDKLIASLNKWENDPKLVPLIHPCRNQDDIESYVLITKEEIKKRLTKYQMYEIYLGDILIGEKIARGRGVGSISLKYLEEEIKKQGLKRIELGVFEFNKNAHKLYQKLGYQEIGKNKQFTFYQDKMWDDIRMEKYT